MLEQLLRFEPKKRITPTAGMRHSYCMQFHDAETEISWNEPPIVNPFDDNKKLSTREYRDALYDRIKNAGRR